jgi:hypothetical protein
VDWSQRILLGTPEHGTGNDLLACSAWRTAGEGEVDLLVDPSPATSPGPDDSLCLFQLPRHLLDTWWRLLERAGETGSGHLEGFDAFAVEVARFLAFKEIPVPEGARFDLLVTGPGQVSVRLEGPAPDPAADAGSRLWGAINLGTEAASLVFLNLPPRALEGELVSHFLTLFPDYPLVRLRIEPGEGYRLPAGGLHTAGCTLDQADPDVWLLVRHGEGVPESVGFPRVATSLTRRKEDR